MGRSYTKSKARWTCWNCEEPSWQTCHQTTRASTGTGPASKFARQKNSPQVVKPAGRPADCLGLTKRWSLYVASHGNSGVLQSTPPTDLSQEQSTLIHRLVWAVASGRRV